MRQWVGMGETMRQWVGMGETMRQWVGMLTEPQTVLAKPTYHPDATCKVRTHLNAIPITVERNCKCDRLQTCLKNKRSFKDYASI